MKKGFTLIELLAVIVILAIIALIATPIVLSIINDSKESVNLRSAEMYLSALENSIATSTLNNKKLTNKSYNILKNGNICIGYNENKCSKELKVEVNGETPSGGKITLSSGEIKDYILNYQEKTIVKDNNETIYSYKENENIEVPDLYNGTLTPVIYDGDNWKVADVSKKWYDYSKQEWANAVILKDDIEKEVGDIVTVEGTNPDVLAMFVWIPRYEYKIEGTYGKGGTSADLPGEIEVNFISSNQLEASEEYRIHPVFNFGGEEISGIWVGKFEISHTSYTTTSLGCTSEVCAEGNNLRVLPNKSSLRSNTVSSFFYGIRSMSVEDNVFGIDSEITDIHMIKNSEWGAVAYLSQSKYGKYGNNDYEVANKEVYQNKSTSFITGNSNGTPSQDESIMQCKYNDITNNCGIGASTTGNIYGIYDMSGGAWEYTMGVFANLNGVLWSGNSNVENSGFSGKLGADAINYKGSEFPNSKYYDVYKASNEITLNPTNSCNSGICYGHALTETSQWYGDYAYFVSATNSWFSRGGSCNYSNDAGLFRASGYYGSNHGSYSTRVTITPTT